MEFGPGEGGAGFPAALLFGGGKEIGGGGLAGSEAEFAEVFEGLLFGGEVAGGFDELVVGEEADAGGGVGGGEGFVAVVEEEFGEECVAAGGGGGEDVEAGGGCEGVEGEVFEGGGRGECGEGVAFGEGLEEAEGGGFGHGAAGEPGPGDVVVFGGVEGLAGGGGAMQEEHGFGGKEEGVFGEGGGGSEEVGLLVPAEGGIGGAFFEGEGALGVVPGVGAAGLDEQFYETEGVAAAEEGAGGVGLPLHDHVEEEFAVLGLEGDARHAFIQESFGLRGIAGAAHGVAFGDFHAVDLNGEGMVAGFQEFVDENHGLRIWNWERFSMFLNREWHCRPANGLKGGGEDLRMLRGPANGVKGGGGGGGWVSSGGRHRRRGRRCGSRTVSVRRRWV